jgi:hypothetical protein
MTHFAYVIGCFSPCSVAAGSVPHRYRAACCDAVKYMRPAGSVSASLICLRTSSIWKPTDTPTQNTKYLYKKQRNAHIQARQGLLLMCNRRSPIKLLTALERYRRTGSYTVKLTRTLYVASLHCLETINFH